MNKTVMVKESGTEPASLRRNEIAIHVSNPLVTAPMSRRSFLEGVKATFTTVNFLDRFGAVDILETLGRTELAGLARQSAPEVQLKEVVDLLPCINEIRQKLFKPDGKPDKEWIVSHGKTWDSARSASLALVDRRALEIAKSVDWRIESAASKNQHSQHRWKAVFDSEARRNSCHPALENAKNAIMFERWNPTSDPHFSDRQPYLEESRRTYGDEMPAIETALKSFLFDEGIRQSSVDLGLQICFVAQLIRATKAYGDPRYIKNALKRLRILSKGYGLMCEFDGTFYVYAKQQ